MWRTANRQAPEIEFDYRKMAIKVDTAGWRSWPARCVFRISRSCRGSRRPFCCSAARRIPRGIVKWTGVRFTDFADMLGLVPGAHYARFVASDRHYVDESMDTLRHPQVMLAWLMNDAPIPPKHGAPLRLVIPFRYGNRSVKAITEIVFGTPDFPPRLHLRSRADGLPSDSASTPWSFVGDIPDLVQSSASERPDLSSLHRPRTRAPGNFRLRSWRIFLVPPEFRAPAKVRRPSCSHTSPPAIHEPLEGMYPVRPFSLKRTTCAELEVSRDNN